MTSFQDLKEEKKDIVKPTANLVGRNCDRLDNAKLIILSNSATVQQQQEGDKSKKMNKSETSVSVWGCATGTWAISTPDADMVQIKFRSNLIILVKVPAHTQNWCSNYQITTKPASVL